MTMRSYLPILLLVISNILFALRAQTSPAMGWR
jgi:hypothetical protein